MLYVGFPGRAGWADLYGQTEQGYLAAILDFHSAWYRDHLVQYIAKSEQLYFGLTGPTLNISQLLFERVMNGGTFPKYVKRITKRFKTHTRDSLH